MKDKYLLKKNIELGDYTDILKLIPNADTVKHEYEQMSLIKSMQEDISLLTGFLKVVDLDLGMKASWLECLARAQESCSFRFQFATLAYNPKFHEKLLAQLPKIVYGDVSQFKTNLKLQTDIKNLIKPAVLQALIGIELPNEILLEIYDCASSYGNLMPLSFIPKYHITYAYLLSEAYKRSISYVDLLKLMGETYTDWTFVLDDEVAVIPAQELDYVLLFFMAQVEQSTDNPPCIYIHSRKFMNLYQSNILRDIEIRDGVAYISNNDVYSEDLILHSFLGLSAKALINPYMS